MPVNDVTTNRSYQKPNIANTLSDDVGRLRSALDAIDTDMASKAPSAGPTFTGVTTVAAGSAAAPSLTFTGATSDTGLYAPGADQLALSTAGTGRLFVDASGKVGIGTSSPEATLDCRGSIISSNGITRYAVLGTDTDGAYLGTDGLAHPLIFKNGNGSTDLERARIDPTGRLLVGTSTARNSLFNIANTYGGLFQVEGTGLYGGTRGAAVITNNSSSAGAFPYLALARANGDSIGSTTIVSNGNTVGMLSFQGCDGLEFVESAKIEAAVDGTPGANDMPGRLVFSTTADGAAAPTEAMRINNAGNLWVGKTSEASLSPISAKAVIRAGSANVLALESSVAGGSVNLDFDGLASNGLQSGPRVRLTQGHGASGWESYFAVSVGGGGSLTERIRLDSSGRLLVGTSTARQLFTSYTPFIQLEGSTFSASSASLTMNVAGTAGPVLFFAKSRGSAPGSVNSVSSNDNLGAILFQGADGVDIETSGARIDAYVDGTPGANDMPGRLVFSTTADGAAAPTEAMRINNQRELLIGTTTRTANGGVLQVSNGITFPGTQSACSDPNTLDDYEEGTWTPGVAGFSTSPTITYTSQAGTYTKIGRQVTVTFKIVVNTSSGGSGGILINGLPFTAGGEYVASLLASGTNFGTSATQLTGRTETSAWIRLYGMLNDGALIDAAVSNVAAGDTLQGTLTFFV